MTNTSEAKNKMKTEKLDNLVKQTLLSGELHGGLFTKIIDETLLIVPYSLDEAAENNGFTGCWGCDVGPGIGGFLESYVRCEAEKTVKGKKIYFIAADENVKENCNTWHLTGSLEKLNECGAKEIIFQKYMPTDEIIDVLEQRLYKEIFLHPQLYNRMRRNKGLDQS